MPSSESERAGLEMVQTFLDTGANMRDLKKFLKEELAALDAEKVSGYDDDNTWDDSWSAPYMN